MKSRTTSPFGDRITPGLITGLNPGQIFVFGSNDLGVHGKGAAKLAESWGAKRGVAEGLSGFTYAIPTRIVVSKSPWTFKPVPLEDIAKSIDSFLLFASHDFRDFLVTRIGCGNAGYEPRDIAPLFKNAGGIINVSLPKDFWDIIKPQGYATDLFGEMY